MLTVVSSTKPTKNKRVMVVHPNPAVLEQLVSCLRNEGHSVISFTKVNDANLYLQKSQFLDKIVVPENLKVFHTMTYKNYLNMFYPHYHVITVDNKSYRQTISIRKKH